ncbi:hypothetical protein ACR77J_07410 [Tissierella praeacuta]|uniref:hypothetical protein n=1 Tax=Tissierella praeacuta TaxID=43131 RepID=UPI003DA59F64
MEDIRKSINDKYEKLQQLEDYEELIRCLNDESRNHWWKVSTPRKEININTGKSRDKFIMFLQDEINRIKADLGIKP